MKNFIQIIFSTAKEDIFWKKIRKLLDFSDKSSQKKYYDTAPMDTTESINIIYLKIEITINEKNEDSNN